MEGKMEGKKREDLLRRIRNMMDIREDRGATEAEAMTAAKMVGDLLEKYSIGLGEVNIKVTECKEDAVSIGTTRSHPVVFIVSAIADYTGTKVWMERGQKEILIKCFGLSHDIEGAIYLVSLCQNTMNRDWYRYKAGSDYQRGVLSQSGLTIRNSFMRGMASRLSERLLKLSREREAKRTDSTTSLMVVKGQVVQDEYAKLELNTFKGRSTKIKKMDWKAYREGGKCGNQVNIGKGIKDK